MKPDELELTFKSRGKMDWLGIAKVVGVAIGVMGGGAGMLSMTRPDSAVADDKRIEELATALRVTDERARDAKQATELQAVDIVNLKAAVLRIEADNAATRARIDTKIDELIRALSRR